MELRDLRTLTTVVDVGGFTRAAERLHLVQSAVSQSVKRLEREVGMQLLERRRDGVVPTEAGVALVRHARFILNSVARAEEDLAAFRDLERGQLQVGILHTAVPLVLAPWIRQVNATHPGLQLRVREGMVDELVDLLRLRVIDVAVLFLPADLPGMEVEELARVELAAVLHPTHPLADREQLSIDELADQRWISFPPQNPGRVWLEDACEQAGFTPSAVLEVDSLSHLKTYVEEAVGVALLPPQACELERRLGSLAIVEVTPRPQVALAAVVDPARPAGRVLEAVRPLLATALGPPD